MQLLDLKPLKIGKVKIPIWYLLILVIGFALLPHEALRRFVVSMSLVLIFVQDVFAQQGPFYLKLRNVLVALGLAFTLMTFLDLF